MRIELVKLVARKDAGVTAERTCPKGYEAPEVRVLGSVAELTQGCDKRLGGSDGFTFMGVDIVCSSG